MRWGFMNKPSKQYLIVLIFGSVTVDLLWVRMKTLPLLEGKEDTDVTCPFFSPEPNLSGSFPFFSLYKQIFSQCIRLYVFRISGYLKVSNRQYFVDQQSSMHFMLFKL